MAKTSSTTSPSEIMQAADKGKFASVYLLQGEEDYYIDKVSQHLLTCALRPEERDFNLDIMYGPDTRANDIINAARQFPMMAERRVVIVREFQSLLSKDPLLSYVQNPMPSTILILLHKHGTLDGRKALGGEIKKRGVVMESKRVYDNMLPSFVNSYVSDCHLSIEQQAVQMLCDHVGSDLTRMASEIDKLRLALAPGQTLITALLVEEQTGISKDYNNFELQNALARRDLVKATQIVNYFNTAPKNYALQLTLSSLFSFFSDLMLTYYAPDKSTYGIAQWLGKPEWMIKQGLLDAKQNYSGRKVANILAQIRATDAKSKGCGGTKTPPEELLKELIFHILH